MKKYCICYEKANHNRNYVLFKERENGKMNFANCEKKDASAFNLYSEAERKRKGMEYTYEKLGFKEKFVIEEIEEEFS